MALGLVELKLAYDLEDRATRQLGDTDCRTGVSTALRPPQLVEQGLGYGWTGGRVSPIVASLLSTTPKFASRRATIAVVERELNGDIVVAPTRAAKPAAVQSGFSANYRILTARTVHCVLSFHPVTSRHDMRGVWNSMYERASLREVPVKEYDARCSNPIMIGVWSG